MVTLFLLLGLLAILIIVAHLLKRPGARGGIESRQILTANELEFFHRLVKALPHYWVFPQVAANALLKVQAGVSKSQQHAIRNRFAQKHVDFVVCERESLNVLAIIELDDKTHNTAKDKVRDELFAEGGYVTHRFSSRRKPSEAEIVALFNPPAHIEEPIQF